MLTQYAQELRQQDCRLLLAGVGDYAWQKLERTGKLSEIGDENVFKVSTHFHESVLQAQAAAEAWINL